MKSTRKEQEKCQFYVFLAGIRGNRSKIYRMKYIKLTCFVAMFAGFLSYNIVIHAQASTAQSSEVGSLREVLTEKITSMEAELATLYDKYTGTASPFIPFETYIQEAKDCANTGYTNNTNSLTLGLGAGCTDTAAIMVDAMVTNTGACPSGWTIRGSGAFDGGYRSWNAGDIRTYAFCVKGNVVADPDPVSTPPEDNSDQTPPPRTNPSPSPGGIGPGNSR